MDKVKFNILIVEDDEQINDALRIYLSKEGYNTIQAYDGKEALDKHTSELIDLILLDVSLPEIDGMEVLKQIRGISDVPIIMLTVFSKEYNKLQGFNLGVDDYITKPFSLKEVVARIRAVLNRAKKVNIVQKSCVNVEEIKINPFTREVFVGDNEISLTKKEFDLLFILVNNSNKLFRTKFGIKFDSIVIDTSINDGKKGYVIIQSFIEPIKETTTILKQQLIVIGLAALIIESVIAYIFAKKFSKPILEINSASKRISEGDFDAEVFVKSNDEVAMLARTINHMARQLKQTDNIKKEFIANISHELKTPISSIQAYGELLLDCDNIGKEEKDKYAEIIVANSKKLTAMVEDILELSEIQSGSYVLELYSFCLIVLIKDIIKHMQLLVVEKNVQIILESFKDELFITADKDKIHSVVCNILQNSIRHSYTNGIIKIKLISEEQNISVSIIDNGEGIPEDKLPYIWERFYKVDKSRKSGKSGAGLGMAIVKEVFELHHYTYGIESQRDIGTRVWFTIPKQVN